MSNINKIREIIGDVERGGSSVAKAYLRDLTTEQLKEIKDIVAADVLTKQGKKKIGIVSYLSIVVAMDVVSKKPKKVVDIREDRAIKEMFKSLGWEVQTLKVGDYNIKNNKIIIERKSADFLQSVFDRRLYQQIYQAMQNGEIVILALDRSLSDLIGECYKRGISDNVLFGIIASLCVMGIVPLFCENKATFVAVVDKIAEKANDDKNRSIYQLIREGERVWAKRDRRLYILTSFEGIGEKTAKKLLDAYGDLKTIFNICLNLSNEDIEAKPYGKKLLNISKQLRL